MAQLKQNKTCEAEHGQVLLSWYDVEARNLPWRFKSEDGRVANPYHVWLSEIMLQQTLVKAVIPYFEKFTVLWPAVHDLADAPLDDVLTQWAGLGYYARARNLHKCAKMVVERHNGRFPEDEKALLALPGIGAYTAAAISAIAFNRYAVVVDGNVERVVSRLFAVQSPLPDCKPELKILAKQITPQNRCGDYAQAMMDLGATICTPRKPACLLCPVSKDCLACQSGIAAQLPKRKPKAPKPRRKGACFYVQSSDGYVLLHKRPDTGLLAKMAEIPTTLWSEQFDNGKACTKDAPVKEWWQRLERVVEHVFTHFSLELSVYVVKKAKKHDIYELPDQSYYWVKLEDLDSQPLPSVMQKVLKAGIEISLQG